VAIFGGKLPEQQDIVDGIAPRHNDSSFSFTIFFLVLSFLPFSLSLLLSQFEKILKQKMVKTTIIARISDGLPLAASMDDEQVKTTLAKHTKFKNVDK
jgi:hypothetical protein